MSPIDDRAKGPGGQVMTSRDTPPEDIDYEELFIAQQPRRPPPGVVATITIGGIILGLVLGLLLLIGYQLGYLQRPERLFTYRHIIIAIIICLTLLGLMCLTTLPLILYAYHIRTTNAQLKTTLEDRTRQLVSERRVMKNMGAEAERRIRIADAAEKRFTYEKEKLTEYVRELEGKVFNAEAEKNKATAEAATLYKLFFSAHEAYQAAESVIAHMQDALIHLSQQQATFDEQARKIFETATAELKAQRDLLRSVDASAHTIAGHVKIIQAAAPKGGRRRETGEPPQTPGT